MNATEQPSIYNSLCEKLKIAVYDDGETGKIFTAARRVAKKCLPDAKHPFFPKFEWKPSQTPLYNTLEKTWKDYTQKTPPQARLRMISRPSDVNGHGGTLQTISKITAFIFLNVIGDFYSYTYASLKYDWTYLKNIRVEWQKSIERSGALKAFKQYGTNDENFVKMQKMDRCKQWILNRTGREAIVGIILKTTMLASATFMAGAFFSGYRNYASYGATGFFWSASLLTLKGGIDTLSPPQKAAESHANTIMTLIDELTGWEAHLDPKKWVI